MKNSGQNTDKEIWRKIPNNYYSPSIHITENGDIGINVGGYVLVAPIEAWHEAGEKAFTVKMPKKEARKMWQKLKRFLAKSRRD